jgi:hypothetical protein
VAAAIETIVVPELRAHIDRISVVESVLSPKGPRYTDRLAVPLG